MLCVYCFNLAVASSPKQLHTNSKPVPDPPRDDSSMVDQVRALHNIFECKIQIKVILQSAYDCHAGQEKIVQSRNLFLLETITRLLLKKTQRFADHPKFF